MYIITVSIHFSSWLGLAYIVVFLIFTVHSYVAPTLNKLIILYIILLLFLLWVDSMSWYVITVKYLKHNRRFL